MSGWLSWLGPAVLVAVGYTLPLLYGAVVVAARLARRRHG